MTLKNELEKYIKNHGLKHYTISLKKNFELTNKIMFSTKDMPDDTSLPERIWSIINEKNEAICDNGNRKKFNTLTKGYRFCSFNCACSLIHQSEKMKIIQGLIDKDKRQEITKKRLFTRDENRPVNELKSFLKNNGFEFQNNVKVKNINITLVIENKKFAIEFVEFKKTQKSKKHQLEKLNAMHENGYRLITIFEDEWTEKKDIVQRRILHFLGKSEFGCGARKTILKEIEWKDAKEFLEKYHIQEAGSSGTVRFGAFYNNELIGVMVFAKPNITRGGKANSGEIELSRFVTDGKSYPGLASKLLQAYVKKYDTEVFTYADKRWSEGNVYLKMGMEHVHDIAPGYSYYDGVKKERQHRWRFQKKEIMHLVEDGENKTERQIMEELNWFRMYDCGNIKFVYNKKNK